MNAVPATTLAESRIPRSRRLSSLAGALVGTAVGDSIGLPMEGLSRRRQQRLFPGPLHQQLLGRYGMISDDTEHTIMVAQSLLEHPNDATLFQRSLAWKLRWWFVALPAGVGFATARSIAKLWLGFPPARSGVMSAGNGPAMRSAIIGAYFANDQARRRQFAEAGTLITHRDPRASTAALAVAETAAWMTTENHEITSLIQTLQQLDASTEWRGLVDELRTAFSENRTIADFAVRIGATSGVSGYAFQTVPVSIYAALRYRDDFRSALVEAVACGGDTDTVGAITGALVGCNVGIEGIPAKWRERLVDWPRSVALISSISEALNRQIETGATQGAVQYGWPAVPLRNLLFLVIVLFHGFRRLLPPY